MKALKLIKNIFLGILAVVFFGFVIFMTVLLLNYNDYGLTEFGDKTLVILKEAISTNDYKKGDLVLVQKQKLENLKVGDNVFAYKVDARGSVSIDYGKIGEIYEQEQAVTYENGSTYSINYVVGTPGKVYHDVGTFLSVIESKWGFLFIVLLPSFLIFIYELYALIVEIKYGSKEEA